MRLFRYLLGSIKEMVRILNVAEKNDAAKSLSDVMSGGRFRRREGLSRFNKIYEWEYHILNTNCTMTMTSVSGHLLGLEFIGQYKKWGSCNPLALYDAGVQKYCPDEFVDIKRTLEKEIRGCQHLIIWTDGDREGENIGFEIIDVCTAVKPNIQVYRARFSEITNQAVARACQNLSRPDKNISDAVDIRQELDLRTGASFTRFQTLRLQKRFPDLLSEQVISYGSCQFPTLGFVVERYKQVQAFVAEPFWKLRVTHTMDDVTADFIWRRNRLFDRLACLVLYEQCLEDPIAHVTDVKSKPKSKWRPQALDTVELEKLASRKLRINAKETMKIAEKLYTQGLISYPRTETNMFTKDIDLRALVEEQTRAPLWGEFANGILEHGPNPRNGSKTDNAHPPIHPTKYTQNLSGDDQKLYEFIVRHFLACCSRDAQGHETTVDIDLAQEKFSASGLMILARNYLDVYPYDKWSGKEMPIYQVGDTFEPSAIEMNSGETTPPPLLTEADLIALMDKHGIGTDATHAEHIEKIKSRMYVGVRPDGKFVPGQLGMGLVEGYDAMGFEMSKPNLRADFEADLKKVCDGTKDHRDVLREQLEKYKQVFVQAAQQATKIDEALSQYLGTEAVILPDQDVEAGGDGLTRVNIPVRPCPICGQDMTLKVKKGGKGFYLSCMGFPDCRSAIWLSDCIVDATVSDALCQQCQVAPMHLINFKFKRGSVPPFVPLEYTGCIGGCDDTLDFMDIKIPRASQTQASLSRQNTAGQPSQSSVTNNSINRPINIHRGIANSPNNDLVNGQPHPNFNQSNSINPSSGRTSNSNQVARNQGNSKLYENTSFNIDQSGDTNRQLNIGARNQSSFDSGFASGQSSVNSAINGINSTRNPMNSFNDSAMDEGSDDIVCNCSAPALLLTVRKAGPNTGRRFYKCQKPNGEGCSFFLWADQNPNDTTSTTQSFTNRSYTPHQSHPPIATSSTACQCNCSADAKQFTVQKDGPNKGRQFYVCAKSRGTDCKFFKWASEVDDTANTNGFHGQQKSRGAAKGRGKQTNAPGNKTAKRPSTCSICGVSVTCSIMSCVSIMRRSYKKDLSTEVTFVTSFETTTV